MSIGIYSPIGLYQNIPGANKLYLRLKIDESSETPIYRQISEQIAALIRSGRLRRGEHLPPERELALQLKIARGTVKKAYESLVHQRYIVAARGRGSTVALDTEGEVYDEPADTHADYKSEDLGSDTRRKAAGSSGAGSRENRQNGSANGKSHLAKTQTERTNGSGDPDEVSANLANGIRSRSLGDNLRVLKGRNQLRPDTEEFEPVIGASGSAVAENAAGASSYPSRAEQADQILTDAIIDLEDLGFNYKQINDLFGLMLARRREQVSHFAIASVDCNPEALGIYQKQLAMLTHMNTARILLTDLHAAASADAMLEPFDLILTTSNHVEELRKLAPKMAGKVVPVIVAPTQATLIALARLENGSRAGVLHQSGRFFSIIRGWLQKSGFQGDVKGFNTELETAEEFESFVSDRSVLVTPPGFAAQLSGEHLRVINRFRLNGGQLIDFEYQIERGSLLHLEELIRSLINQTRK